MSAIAGAIGTAEPSLVVRMLNAIRHRGPDGVTLCSRRHVHLAAATLATAPHAAAAWPRDHPAPRTSRQLIFDGELANARELRDQLRQQGYVFESQTDAEVVMHLYDAIGAECACRLRGAFAFAVLDGAHLLLARDPLGGRPLYYAAVANSLFLFASEIKGILQCPAFSPRLNERALADASLIGTAVGTDTLIDGITAVAPGHTISVSCSERPAVGDLRPYPTRRITRDATLTIEEAIPPVERALTEAVATSVASAEAIGLALSGGLDSTVLALLAHDAHPRQLLTFTVADHERHPDFVAAAAVARTIGSEHHPLVFGFEDYLAAIPHCVAIEERPISLFGVPFYALCRTMATRTHVCVLGEGADAQLGGSDDYFQLRDRSQWPARLAALERIGLAPSDRMLAIIDGFASCDSVERALEWTFEFNWREPLERWTMEFADRIAMAVGVQARMPFLDDRVIEAVGRCPVELLVRPNTRIGKYVLKRWCLERFGESPAIVDAALRAKINFPSAGVGLHNRLDELCEQVLPDDYLSRHELGICFNSKLQLLMFELFVDIFLTHRGDSSVVGSIGDFIDARARRRSAGPRRRRALPASQGGT